MYMQFPFAVMLDCAYLLSFSLRPTSPAPSLLQFLSRATLRQLDLTSLTLSLRVAYGLR